MDDSRDQFSRLSIALLAYMAFLVLLITLFPFNFSWPADKAIGWYLGLFDASTNVLMFIPLGFLFRLSFARRWDLFLLQTLAAGMGFSVLIETTQLFLADRETNLADVATNSFGAFLGGAIQLVASRFLSPRIKERFVFDLPVLSLVYFSSLLIWLNGEASRLDPARLWLSPILGAAAATVLAAVWFYQLKPHDVFSREGAIFLIGGWFMASSLLALRVDPNFTAGCAVGVAAIAFIELAVPGFFPRGARRFETIVLWMTTPVFLAYLVCLVLWPFSDFTNQFRGMSGLPKYTLTPMVAILGLIEWVTAFTLLGYLAAEWRGRRVESRGVAWAVIAFTAFLASAGSVAVRGFHPHHQASIVELIFGAMGAAAGGAIYRMQLSVIRGRTAAAAVRAANSPAWTSGASRRR